MAARLYDQLPITTLRSYHENWRVQGAFMSFMYAAKASDIPSGQIREIRLDGITVALGNVDGHFYAINNTCLHRGGPLGQGSLQGTVVTCPWHGWTFDMTSGQATHNRTAGLACYPVEVRGEDVYVDIVAAL